MLSRRFFSFLLSGVAALALSGCSDDGSSSNSLNIEVKNGNSSPATDSSATKDSSSTLAASEKETGAAAGAIVFQTSKGEIVVELNDELTPATSANFRKLVNAGFYDGLIFHRYVPSFVIQGGDPTGTGMSGSEETVALEIPCQDGSLVTGKTTTCPVALPHDAGVIAMARSADPNSASSQFYFTLEKQRSLDGNYAVFGKVVKGMDVVLALRKDDTMTKVTEAEAAG